MAAKSDYKWVLSLDTQVNDSQLKQLYSTLSRLGDESTIEFKFEADGKSATKQVNEVLSSINKDLEKKQIDLSKVFELGDLANKIKKDNDEVKELVGLFSGLNEIVKSFAGTDLSRSFTSGTSAVSDLSDRFDDLSEKIKEVKDKLDDIGSDAGSSSGEFYANLSRIDDSLSSISNNLTIIRQAFKTFTDEDTEFSPLFDSINKVTSSIVELKDTVSGVKLNLNLDVGSETSERLNQKTSKVVSRQLEAYQKLYDAMKRTGRLTKEMTLLNTDGMSDSELVGKYRQIIESAEKHYSTSNGKSNIYKDVLGEEYTALKHEIDLANDQLGRVDNKRNKEGLLSKLLGTGDLSGIVQQLENISSILLDIKISFENGLGIQSSIEKVSELADKVESVDSKLQSADNTKKIPVTSLISNKSSSDEQISEQNKLQKKDAFQENTMPETKGMDQIENATKEAVQVKKDFATANEGVQSSIDESKSPLQLEAELMDQIAKSAREAADAKKEFVDANKQVKDSADDSNDSAEEKKRKTRKKAFENVRRISEDEFISDNSNYSSIANNYLKQNGYTILGDSVSTKFTDGLVKVTAKVKDAEGAWKTFSATVDSDTNSLLKPNFTSVTGSVDRLEKKLSEFGKESTHLSLGDIEKSVETVKNALSEKIPNFTDNFNVDVNEKGVVSITQKLKDTTTTAKTLSQTFNNVDDAIKHFGNSASSSAERTKVSLKSVQEVASETTKSVSDSSDKIIKKARSIIDSYEKFITSDKTKREGSGNEFGIDYINAQNKAQNIISELNAEIAKYANSGNDGAKLQSIRNNIEQLTESLKSQLTVLKNTNKGVKGIQIEKMLQKINKLKSYTGADFGLKKEVDDLEKNILSLGKNGNASELMRQLISLENKFDSTNNAAKSFLDTIKEKTWYSWAGNLASMFSIYDVINLGRTGVQVVTDLDTAFTEMKKVSDETTQSLKNFQSESFALADKVGTTAKTIQDSTADWMRLGESLNEAKKSASTSNILLNVSEFDNISDATDSLVAMSQAYKDLDKLTIVDKLNEVGNNYSISTDELAQGLQKSAATLSLMGNTIDEAAALITTANSVIRDADSVSAGLRTISLRIVGTSEAEEELSAMNEEVDAFVKATNSKKQQIIKDYTSVASNSYQGFDILDENGNYKNTYEILLGIAKIYKEIQEQDKKLGTNHATALVEELAGKNRSNIAAAILQDPEQIESVLKSSQEAAGSAQKELNSYLDSIEGRTQKLQNKAQEFWYRAIDTDVIKDGISLLTNLLDLITSIVGKVGLLPPLLGTLGAVGLSHSGLD